MREGRLLPRVLALLAGPGFGAFALAAACEPQDIYLFDAERARTRPDAGTSEPQPALEDPSMSEGPDAAQPGTEVFIGEQPDCRSTACDACLEPPGCAIAGPVFLCHPESGECLLACDPDALPGELGTCPGAQRCHSEFGLCVTCMTSDDCDGTRPACDGATGTCVECSADSDCAGRGLVCLESEQRCVRCEFDTDCNGAEDERRCLPGEQRCVECVSNADCTDDPQRPICSPERECEDVED